MASKAAESLRSQATLKPVEADVQTELRIAEASAAEWEVRRFDVMTRGFTSRRSALGGIDADLLRLDSYWILLELRIGSVWKRT